MKLDTILAIRSPRTNATRRRRAAKAAARFRRPVLHLEQLEDRAMLSGQGDIEWLHQFGSGWPPGGEDPACAVVVDAEGSVYVAGHLFHVLPGQTGAGGLDAYLRKYDAHGNELWTRQFGTTGDDAALGVAAHEGGVYVTGFISGVLPGQTSAGSTDAFVRKYDTDGNVLWTRQFGTTGLDEAACVAVDGSGVYVGGSVSSTPNHQDTAFVRKFDTDGNEQWTHEFRPTVLHIFGDAHVFTVGVDASGVYAGGWTAGVLPGQVRESYVDGYDAFVRKYDTDGHELWTRQFGAINEDRPSNTAVQSLAVGVSGVYVAGHTTSTLPGQTRGEYSDAFVRRYDADGNELWTRQFTSSDNDPATGDNDSVLGVAVDNSGVYLAGITEAAFPGQTEAGGAADAFVRKYDAVGNELWTKQFGTTETDIAYGIAVNAAGVYVAGQADGTLPGGGTGQSFLRKYDAGGTDIFTRQFGPAMDGPIDAARAVDADGNVYVAGDVTGNLPGQTGAGGLGAPFDGEAFVRKYDVAGNELWTRQFGTAGFDQALFVAVDLSGIYVTGYTTGALPGQSSAGGHDAFVRKYDDAGNELWTRQFGTSGTDSAFSIAVDETGVFVTGSTTGAFSGQFSAGGQDAFVRKYDAAGNELWTRQFGTADWDQATSSATDAAGVYISGFTSATFAGQASAGEYDVFLRKYGTDGNELWTRQFGSSSADEAYGIAADTSGVYVAGRTAGTLPNQASAGLTDGFVRKYDASGAEVWTRQFGSSSADQVLGVTVGPTGVYAAGSSEGTLPCQVSAGLEDAFLRKFDFGGNAIWTSQFGTAGSDWAAGVHVGDAGLFVAGFTTDIFPGQTGGGMWEGQPGPGGQDAFVAKIVDGSTPQSCGGNTAPSNVALTPSASSINENSTLMLTGSFTDPDTGDTHAVVIDWGPGEGTTSLNLAAGVNTFSASHTYLDDSPPGTASDVFTVSATVTEPAGGSASGSNSITVNNVLPMAVLDLATTNEDDAIAIAVLANDSDVAGALDPFRIDSVTSGLLGTTAIDTKGTPQTTDDEIVYTPNPGTSGSDSFTYTISDGDGGIATATVSVQIRNLVDLSGRVFDDKDNDGAFEPESGDIGIVGATVQLLDETSAAVVATQITAGDGTYFFDVNLGPGAYKVVAAQPAGSLDGRESAGNLGGIVNNTQDSNQITGINVGGPGTTADAIDYLFAIIHPSQGLGMVWSDLDNDGEVDFGERAIPGVAIELTGLDDRGQAIRRNATTDANGVYAFLELRPSDLAGYTVRELQPAGYGDGLDVPGTVNGMAAGSNSANDTFSGVVLPRPGSLAENYNFGERPLSDGGVQQGQTATIGYWQNKNGQNLINSLNGGHTSTQLGNWLAGRFPNMYGALVNLTNAQVAAYYKSLFVRTASTAAGGGPAKMDAQVMATALAVYVTNQTLAGTTATAYGFLVTGSGVGTRTINVGTSGAAFGVANYTSVTVLDLLLAANSRSRNGLLFDLDGDGDANDLLETTYRIMANDVFSAINEAGDI